MPTEKFEQRVRNWAREGDLTKIAAEDIARLAETCGPDWESWVRAQLLHLAECGVWDEQRRVLSTLLSRGLLLGKDDTERLSFLCATPPVNVPVDLTTTKGRMFKNPELLGFTTGTEPQARETRKAAKVVVRTLAEHDAVIVPSGTVTVAADEHLIEYEGTFQGYAATSEGTWVVTFASDCETILDVTVADRTKRIDHVEDRVQTIPDNLEAADFEYVSEPVEPVVEDVCEPQDREPVGTSRAHTVSVNGKNVVPGLELVDAVQDDVALKALCEAAANVLVTDRARFVTRRFPTPTGYVCVDAYITVGTCGNEYWWSHESQTNIVPETGTFVLWWTQPSSPSVTMSGPVEAAYELGCSVAVPETHRVVLPSEEPGGEFDVRDGVDWDAEFEGEFAVGAVDVLYGLRNGPVRLVDRLHEYLWLLWGSDSNNVWETTLTKLSCGVARPWHDASTFGTGSGVVWFVDAGVVGAKIVPGNNEWVVTELFGVGMPAETSDEGREAFFERGRISGTVTAQRYAAGLDRRAREEFVFAATEGKWEQVEWTQIEGLGDSWPPSCAESQGWDPWQVTHETGTWWLAPDATLVMSHSPANGVWDIAWPTHLPEAKRADWAKQATKSLARTLTARTFSTEGHLKERHGFQEGIGVGVHGERFAVTALVDNRIVEVRHVSIPPSLPGAPAVPFAAGGPPEIVSLLATLREADCAAHIPVHDALTKLVAAHERGDDVVVRVNEPDVTSGMFPHLIVASCDAVLWTSVDGRWVWDASLVGKKPAKRNSSRHPIRVGPAVSVLVPGTRAATPITSAFVRALGAAESSFCQVQVPSVTENGSGRIVELFVSTHEGRTWWWTRDFMGSVIVWVHRTNGPVDEFGFDGIYAHRGYRSHLRADGLPKQRYSTLEVAKRKAAELNRSVVSKGQVGGYSCGECNGYHIGRL